MAHRPVIVTRDDVTAALRRVGLGRGDVLFVHNSIRSLGYVVGGPEAVVDALLFTVGPTGHVTVPTFTSCRTTARNKQHTVFDVDETPSKLGIIGETLRRRPNAHRSVHPTKSLAAIGPRAEALVAGAAGGTDFDIDGPYGRLVGMGAWVVYLGTRIGSNSMLHVVEDWLDLPYMADREARIYIDGRATVVPERRAPEGHRGFYGGEDRPYNRRLFAAGIIRQTHLNHARVLAVPAKDLVRFALDRERERPGSMLCDDAACDFCVAGRAACVKKREHILDQIGMVEARGLCA